MKIFLSISSYKDPLLVNTLQSAYENAHHKENIVFAVVDQSDSRLDLEELVLLSKLDIYILMLNMLVVVLGQDH